MTIYIANVKVEASQGAFAPASTCSFSPTHVNKFKHLDVLIKFAPSLTEFFASKILLWISTIIIVTITMMLVSKLYFVVSKQTFHDLMVGPILRKAKETATVTMIALDLWSVESTTVEDSTTIPFHQQTAVSQVLSSLMMESKCEIGRFCKSFICQRYGSVKKLNPKLQKTWYIWYMEMTDWSPKLHFTNSLVHWKQFSPLESYGSKLSWQFHYFFMKMNAWQWQWQWHCEESVGFDVKKNKKVKCQVSIHYLHHFYKPVCQKCTSLTFFSINIVSLQLWLLNMECSTVFHSMLSSQSWSDTRVKLQYGKCHS